MKVTLPQRRGVELATAAPPSKSYTHRALVIAALADGESTITNPLAADDTRLTAAALQQLGVPLRTEERRITVAGRNGSFHCSPETKLDLENSGTSLRLLSALALLADNAVLLTGSGRMQERPVGPLAGALQQLGGTVVYRGRQGFPPICVRGPFKGGPALIDGSISSQFISSILLSAPYAEDAVELEVTGTPASESYIEITTDIMTDFGGVVRRTGPKKLTVDNSARYRGRTFVVEGDYSSASYFFALAAICGGRVEVTGLNPVSVQGDRFFLDVLRQMGCTVSFGMTAVTVEHEGRISGVNVDMSSAPDSVQTLCMVAAVGRTPTVITGISHLKYKETDRIAATAERLRMLGADIHTDSDRIIIRPATLHGGTIEPANDHRIAMSFAVLGMGIGGVSIINAECVNKSFPAFWDQLAKVTQ